MKNSSVWVCSFWLGHSPYLVLVGVFERVDAERHCRGSWHERLGAMILPAATTRPSAASESVPAGFRQNNNLKQTVNGPTTRPSTIVSKATKRSSHLLSTLQASILCRFLSRMPDPLRTWLAVRAVAGLSPRRRVQDSESRARWSKSHSSVIRANPST
eukprot:1650921-Rhodomonas_salina.7